ncbi:MAG: DinB family protein [Citrobacter freundii]|nr:MAG: DinB family protein [Citrobacter freundii]
MQTQEIILKQIVQAWDAQVAATDKLLEQFSETQWMKPVAPSRNRGIYILGHLVAIHDLMLPLLRFQDACFPELHQQFVRTPDNADAAIPSLDELKKAWNTVNEKLRQHMNELTAEQWTSRHGNVSDEDFAKEPHRNRINVLISRTNHLSYHRGQLILLADKA